MKSPILATLMIGIAGLATGTVVVSQTSQDSGQDQRILKGSVADPAPYTPAGSYKSIPLEDVDRGMQHKVCLSQFRSPPSTIWAKKIQRAKQCGVKESAITTIMHTILDI
jgi:hypothetical protein